MSRNVIHRPSGQISQERKTYLEKSCESLYIDLEKNWEEMTENDQLFLLRIMIEEKHCEHQHLVPFLHRLLESEDDSYRYLALDLIGEIDFENKRNLLVNEFTGDPDETIRNYALILLTNSFPNQRDKEILGLALRAFDDPNSSIATRLAAGAAMMYQLGIPHDEQGRPAWWDEKEEELHHPKIQEAIFETRRLLENE